MGMFLTIIESGSAATLNITAETILFYVVDTEIEFEIKNEAITWEMV